MWTPSHTVPAAGMSMWDEPDAQRTAPYQLDPGLEVQMVQRSGTWARVVCSNDFAGWVQSAQLVPIEAAATEAVPTSGVAAVGDDRRRAWIAAAVVAGLVVVGGIWLATSGDDDPPGTGPTASTVVGDASPGLGTAASEASAPNPSGAVESTLSAVGSVAPTTTGDSAAPVPAVSVELNLPPGWTLSADGLVAAEDPADLDAAAPVGPVVRAEVGAPADAADFEATFQDAVARADEPFEFVGPEETFVDGYDALVLIVREQGRSKILITVDPVGGEAVLFTLDAPADRVDELDALLATIPGFTVAGSS